MRGLATFPQGNQEPSVLKTRLEVKTQDTILLPITAPNVDRFSKFFHRVMKQSLRSHCTSNASLHYLVKCKCRETIDNLKYMKSLTKKININYYNK